MGQFPYLRGRRYRFGQQAEIAYWNLGQLANALAPAFASVEPLKDGLQRYVDTYNEATRNDVAAKLGLDECREKDLLLLQALHGLMHTAEVDMTIFFRALADVDVEMPNLAPFEDAFYDEAKRKQAEPEFNDWLGSYAARLREDTLSAEQRRERLLREIPDGLDADIVYLRIESRLEDSDFYK